MNAAPTDRTRLRIGVRGAVQGVGFRPFVFRLATELRLKGWVSNSPRGVMLEVEGRAPRVQQFLLRLEAEKPPPAVIQSLEPTWLDPAGYTEFRIRPSDHEGERTTLVLPDLATCPDCRREIFDPGNRRYFYPFTNCTHCGPRFSIIEALPYDRTNTVMREFAMCDRCQAEYDDPEDRRFHAQPNACPICGPQIDLWDQHGIAVDAKTNGGGTHRRNHRLLARTAEAIRAGKIVAVKGIGGFHLIVAGHNENAVRRLRHLKHREEKPFALMFPDLETVRAACEISPLEERLLCSSEAPIVLLRRMALDRAKPRAISIADAVAPGNPNLGVMLPSNPLHQLMMSLLPFPVVATSGNLSDEPLCTDEREALQRLGGIADLYLVHNRRIARHLDDSVVRVMLDREMILRRARGYAPLPATLRAATENSASNQPEADVVLAVGTHLKNSVALAIGPQVFISQHIGDLETNESVEAFRKVIRDLGDLYEVEPSTVAADAHPDYASSDLAMKSGLPLVRVQHHVAHVLSCMADNELDGPVLGVAWDGTGYGDDGTIWGGEFFRVTDTYCERVGHLRRFPLPGGDQVAREPWRAALGLLYELIGPQVFDRAELASLAEVPAADRAILKSMLARRLNSPLTSSAGRLFDAASSIIGLRQRSRFEGQAAMELEFAAESVGTDDAYLFALDRFGGLTLNWGPLFAGLLQDCARAVAPAQMAAKFHNALAEMIVTMAREVAEERVVLSGGCFQNRYLTERTVRRLRQEGFKPYWHQRVPTNDGGIALGQVAGALREQRKVAPCV